MADRERARFRSEQLKITWTCVPRCLAATASMMRCAREKLPIAWFCKKGMSSPLSREPRTSPPASYHAPYQAHAPFGPNGALADVTPDSALVICSTQDVYATRNALAGVLGVPSTKVRVQYYEGSGTYGHSCYDDAAQAAAILSQLAGKPVRLQFMRWDEHGWDLYGQGTSVKYVPQPMRTAKSSPISTTAGITTERRRNLRAARARNPRRAVEVRRRRASKSQ